MLHFDHGYVTCLYVPFYLVGDACAQIVAILLVRVSILACCSALCIFKKYILAFVDLIHALPIRGRKVTNSCFQGELCVTEPLKLIPYYCLNHSSWPLRNNIEVTYRLCRVGSDKSLTSQDRHLYNKLTRRRVQR
jgi:hypothetical protein